MFQTEAVDKMTKHISPSTTFFSENRAVCEIMWENMAERDRLQVTM